MTLDTDVLGTMLAGLLEEGYDEPADPRMTWFADNEAGCGFLGTLSRLDAATASRPFRDGERASAATHAGHLLYSLQLANRSLRGEKAYETADWKRSWSYDVVDDAAWKALLGSLRAEYEALQAAVKAGLPWTDPMSTKGIFGQLAHGAWHLGAIRQGLGLIRLDS